MTSSLRSVAVCLALLAAGTVVAAPRAWVEMTATGAQARVVTAAPSCPDILIDGHARPMSQRAAPTDAFPGRVCQADLPVGARRLSVEGVALPAPKAQVNRIVILGDSGCRLKGAFVQNCNDPAAWPFAKVAALAAKKKPDLVIHVGDYYYRETPCPAGVAGCAGSPYGDRWPSWDAELYVPAAPLLAAAPWVFARGNHEDCHRGGTGWFRLLDAGPAPKACPAASDTFSVELKGLRLILVDSADTDDRIASGPLVADFDRELDAIGHPHTDTPGWIITHRPIWYAARKGAALSDGVTSATERAAVKGRDLAGVSLIVSGHTHFFSSLSFGSSRPSQLIVGTGGDVLETDEVARPATGTPLIDGLTASIFAMGRFGYFVFDRDGTDWVGRFYDVTGAVAATCLLHRRALRCSPF